MLQICDAQNLHRQLGMTNRYPEFRAFKFPIILGKRKSPLTYNTASNHIIKVQFCEIAKVYDELEEITGYSRNTIQKFKHIAESTSEVRNDESLLRSKDVKFSHYEVVASLNAEDQKEFLQKTSDEKLANVCSPMGED